MKITPDRVISVPLSNEDWQAFVATEREPVQWLKQQIAQSIARTREGAPGDRAATA
ncbi:MAG: hypothetical protein Q8L86_03245 [Vicinamibacterales bacterium]|nr:hypothetical protein [Vicinamibacterales bacterium]